MYSILVVLTLWGTSSLLGWTPARPPPPSPIIKGLAHNYGSDGRYYSDTAPYSIKIPLSWKGSGTLKTGVAYDRFNSSDGLRYLEIQEVPNRKGYSQSEVEQGLLRSIAESGSLYTLGGFVALYGKRFPIFYFNSQGVMIEEVVFLLAHRIWIMAAVSNQTHAREDRIFAKKALLTFRLEHISL